jgi:hypothetical protein
LDISEVLWEVEEALLNAEFLKEIRRLCKGRKDVKLTPLGRHLLHALHDELDYTPSQLANFFEITPSAVSYQLNNR